MMNRTSEVAIMKALVKYAKGKGNMEIRDVPVPRPAAGEVLVRVDACGICGTDLKIQDDEFINNPPVIVGHELAGHIEAIGDGVTTWQIGDRVVAEQHVRACGQCAYCLTGRRQFCAAKRSPGYLSDGAFAECIALDASLLHAIPPGITCEEAALIEPMAVAAYGILERAGIRPQDQVVILGCGPIALLALQMVKAAGAARVFMTGLDADARNRFAAARKYGCDGLVNVQQEDPVQKIMSLNVGSGVDVVIDLAGAAQAIVQGFELLKKDGTFCALGLPHGPVSLPWARLALQAVRIIFSYSSDYISWDRCLSLIASGKVRLDDFTRDIYPLDDWEAAFARARSGEALKVIIKPN
jgi:L-iditol 2-dehydrogenase